MRRAGWAERLILALAAVALSAVVALTLVGLIQAARATPTPQPQQVSAIGPDIRHCFDEGETRDLWDCIRGVDQRTDP